MLIQNLDGDLHDLEGHMRNAAGQKIDDQEAVIPVEIVVAVNVKIER